MFSSVKRKELIKETRAHECYQDVLIRDIYLPAARLNPNCDKQNLVMKPAGAVTRVEEWVEEWVEGAMDGNELLKSMLALAHL